MKKVAILMDSMHTGGIEKVSVEFMKRLTEYFDVTLLLRKREGELINDIPSSVKIEMINKKSFNSNLLFLLKRGKLISLLLILAKYFYATRIKKNYVISSRVTSKIATKISNERFDLAINYHGTHFEDISDVLNGVNANKKICFIHGEHDFHDIHVIKEVEKEYLRFDKIFCVSEHTMNMFLKDFPAVKDKVEVYLNPINTNEIIEKSKLKPNFEFDKKKINIVTVGRISKEKGQDLIPQIAKMLNDNGVDFKWYIVGDGSDRERVENLVKKNNVEKEVVFCGNQINPYPFIKNCDIYVQPSYSEGYCTTICESGILGKAIIGTRLCQLVEMTNNQDAFFVDASVNSLYSSILLLISDNELKKKLENNVKKIDFSHYSEINKILVLC